MYKLLFVLLLCQAYANDIQSMQSKLHQNLNNLNTPTSIKCDSYKDLFELAINTTSIHASFPIEDQLAKLLLVKLLGTFNNGLNNEDEDLSRFTPQYHALKSAQDSNSNILQALTLFIIETFDPNTEQENLLNASCLAIALWAHLKYEEEQKLKPSFIKNAIFVLSSTILAASLVGLIVFAILPANNKEIAINKLIVLIFFIEYIFEIQMYKKLPTCRVIEFLKFCILFY